MDKVTAHLTQWQRVTEEHLTHAKSEREYLARRVAEVDGQIGEYETTLREIDEELQRRGAKDDATKSAS